MNRIWLVAGLLLAVAGCANLEPYRRLSQTPAGETGALIEAMKASGELNKHQTLRVMVVLTCRDLGYEWSYDDREESKATLAKIEAMVERLAVDLDEMDCLHMAMHMYRSSESRVGLPNSGNWKPAPLPEDELRRLIALGVDVNHPGDWGKKRTPLFYAAGTRIEFAKDQSGDYLRAYRDQPYMLLMSLGGRDDVRDRDGLTPKQVFLAVHRPKAPSGSGGENAQILMQAVQLGLEGARQEQIRQHAERQAVEQRDRQYQQEHQAAVGQQTMSAEQAYQDRLEQFRKNRETAAPAAPSAHPNKPSAPAPRARTAREECERDPDTQVYWDAGANKCMMQTYGDTNINFQDRGVAMTAEGPARKGAADNGGGTSSSNAATQERSTGAPPDRHKGEEENARRALAVSWRLESGKWKAFGPTQGSLGIAEDSEKTALVSAGGANGTLIGDFGKFRIYDLGRLLGGGDMDVYGYARDAYKLDLSRFE